MKQITAGNLEVKKIFVKRLIPGGPNKGLYVAIFLILNNIGWK